MSGSQRAQKVLGNNSCTDHRRVLLVVVSLCSFRTGGRPGTTKVGGQGRPGLWNQKG